MNIKKIAIYSIIGYIFYIFFYGIFIKLTINNPVLFELKTILPEVLLAAIVIIAGIVVIGNKKANIKGNNLFIFIVYILFVFVMNIFTNPSIDEISLVIRDLILPLLSFLAIYNLGLDNDDIDIIISSILKIFIVFTIFGFILALAQQLLGWEWSSKFYTGYSFYGQDPISKVVIRSGHGFLRVPSLTGQSVSFGFYNLVAFIFIMNILKKSWYKGVLLIMSIGSILLSTSKTAIIALLVVIFIQIINKFDKKTKSAIVSISPIFIVVLLFIGLKIDKNILFSIKDRFNLWTENLVLFNPIEFIIPLNLFNTTSASSTGFLSILDNTYLYFIISLGICGFILFMINIYNLSKLKNLDINNKILKYVILVFIISSFLINLTQGRAYFNVFCIIAPVLYLRSRNQNDYYL